MTGGPLRGRAVLVTRAREQAAPLMDAIREAGGEPLLLPALEIVPVAAAPGRADDPDPHRHPHPDLVVFVSPNAVRQGARYLALPGSRTAAIGPATAEAMRRAGRTPDLVPVGGYDSESLLAEPSLAAMAGRQVLIVRGKGGRELLADTLRARGAAVDYAEVYERRLPVPRGEEMTALLTAFREGRLGFVTCLSVATLHNLAQLLGEHAAAVLRGTTLVSASERVLQLAVSEDLAGDTLLAQGPEPSDLVQAMIFPPGTPGQSGSDHD